MPSHAFEIGFDTSGLVMDHSPVMFNDLPGAAGFEDMLQNLKGKVSPLELALIRQQQEWFTHTVTTLVARDKLSESFTCGGSHFRVEWKRSLDTAATFTIYEGDRLATASLLISGKTPKEDGLASPPDARAALHFVCDVVNLLRDRGEAFQFEQAHRLIDMTRRPLLASVFWPPLPDPLSDLRTAQRSLAYAFFKSEGVME